MQYAKVSEFLREEYEVYTELHVADIGTGTHSPTPVIHKATRHTHTVFFSDVRPVCD